MGSGGKGVHTDEIFFNHCEMISLWIFIRDIHRGNCTMPVSTTYNVDNHVQCVLSVETVDNMPNYVGWVI